MKNKETLAEIIGIMLGDGCLYKGHGSYQTIITSGKNEREWIMYVKNLFENYFEKTFKIVEIKYGIQAKCHSKEILEKFLEVGLCHGNKVHNKVTIPPWLFLKRKYLIKTVQGLFDTDGCVYNKYGKYAQIEFKFGCEETTISVCNAVSNLGFNTSKVQKQYNNATGKYRWRFYLCRQKEIDLFFDIIKPKNSKHIERYKKIRSGDTGTFKWKR